MSHYDHVRHGDTNLGVGSGYDTPEEKEIERLRQQLAAANKRADTFKALLVRYRNETPLGHQPHMIAHQVDEVIRNG